VAVALSLPAVAEAVVAAGEVGVAAVAASSVAEAVVVAGA
jgi:hypothetical protein